MGRRWCHGLEEQKGIAKLRIIGQHKSPPNLSEQGSCFIHQLLLLLGVCATVPFHTSRGDECPALSPPSAPVFSFSLSFRQLLSDSACPNKRVCWLSHTNQDDVPSLTRKRKGGRRRRRGERGAYHWLNMYIFRLGGCVCVCVPHRPVCTSQLARHTRIGGLNTHTKPGHPCRFVCSVYIFLHSESSRNNTSAPNYIYKKKGPGFFLFSFFFAQRYTINTGRGTGTPGRRIVIMSSTHISFPSPRFPASWTSSGRRERDGFIRIPNPLLQEDLWGRWKRRNGFPEKEETTRKKPHMPIEGFRNRGVTFGMWCLFRPLLIYLFPIGSLFFVSSSSRNCEFLTHREREKERKNQQTTAREQKSTCQSDVVAKSFAFLRGIFDCIAWKNVFPPQKKNEIVLSSPRKGTYGGERILFISSSLGPTKEMILQSKLYTSGLREEKKEKLPPIAISCQ